MRAARPSPWCRALSIQRKVRSFLLKRKFFLSLYILRERERERERERIPSGLCAVSTEGSNSRTVRSWPEPRSRVGHLNQLSYAGALRENLMWPDVGLSPSHRVGRSTDRASQAPLYEWDAPGAPGQQYFIIEPQYLAPQVGCGFCLLKGSQRSGREHFSP